jgi:BNR repeat-containing family member
MRPRVLGPLLALAVIAAGAVQAQAGAPERARAAPAKRATSRPRSAAALVPREQVGSFGHGSWCWFGDPRAVRVVGRYDETYVGWIDWRGQITVGAYDPSFGAMRTHVIGHMFHDDHSSPAIFVEPDKRLTVFWSGHDGPTMFYRSTLRPEDISAWGPVERVHSRLRGPNGFTYPNPVLLPGDANKLYVFWRGADWSADFATRTLDGRWSPTHELIRNPGQRPYLKVAADGGDAVALAFTDGHPRNVLTSVYYAELRGGSLWHAGGRRIAAVANGPIHPRQGDVVYDGAATGVSSWVWDVGLDSTGRPVILYATFPSASRHLYWYAHWNGRRWVSHLMTFAGGTISPQTIEYEYSGGMTLDHANPSVVYLSRYVNGRYEIERWITRDGGYTWSHVTVVRTRGADDYRPLVPRGSGGGPMSLLWLQGRYGSYTNYRTAIAFLK